MGAGEKWELSKGKLPVIRSISPGCNVQHTDYSQQYYMAYLKVAKRVDLETSHQKKKIMTVWWWMLTCGNHFII